MSKLILPEPVSIEITRHGQAHAMFEPAAARCTCSTAPCCCCWD